MKKGFEVNLFFWKNTGTFYFNAYFNPFLMLFIRIQEVANINSNFFLHLNLHLKCRPCFGVFLHTDISDNWHKPVFTWQADTHMMFLQTKYTLLPHYAMPQILLIASHLYLVLVYSVFEFGLGLCHCFPKFIVVFLSLMQLSKDKAVRSYVTKDQLAGRVSCKICTKGIQEWWQGFNICLKPADTKGLSRRRGHLLHSHDPARF